VMCNQQVGAPRQTCQRFAASLGIADEHQALAARPASGCFPESWARRRRAAVHW
jgi:hypothetical protein